MEKIGLLAGIGFLPVECAKAARAQGYEVYVVALLPETEKCLQEYATDYQEIGVFKVGKILKYLRDKEVTQVTMIGKVRSLIVHSL